MNFNKDKFKYDVEFLIIGVSDKWQTVRVSTEKRMDMQITDEAWLRSTDTLIGKMWYDTRNPQRQLLAGVYKTYKYMHPQTFKERLVIRSVKEVK